MPREGERTKPFELARKQELSSLRLHVLRACLVPTKIPIISNVWTHAWSIKNRLITKLIAQLATNLRDESFKPN